MGSGIAHGEQRIQVRNCFFTNIRLHVLRLIHYHNRIGCLQMLDGLDTSFPDLVDDILVFGEAVNVDYQDLNGIAASEIGKTDQLFWIVHFKIGRYVFVDFLKVVEGNL